MDQYRRRNLGDPLMEQAFKKYESKRGRTYGE